MEKREYKMNWLGRELVIKSGQMARQATASLTLQYGETVILATIVESESERDGVDFFPLMVEFEEKLYAAGIIKGSRWVKREGRPTDEAVLAGRMVDRSIRPLFNQAGKKDIQVILSVLSTDKENDFDVLGLVAASAVLSMSGIEWRGPIAGIRVGRVDGKFIYNPTYTERKVSDLDLIVASTKEKVIMIEAGANEVTSEDMYTAIQEGFRESQSVLEFILGIKKDYIGKIKEEVEIIKEVNVDKDRIKNETNKWLDSNIQGILFNKEYYSKFERKLAVKEIKKQLTLFLVGLGYEESLVKWVKSELVEMRVEAEVTNGIIKNKKRVDGRVLNEIRELSSEVKILPRVHGSSLFSRGETQVMSIVTLASPGNYLMLEGIEGEEKKRYMHHYNFPPFSVGEAKPMRSIGRREIGHGALAEKALAPVLPSLEDFPYTIRVVSETLGSNGSSSMASTCASTLALMDAGVPLTKKVGGIAMGLASNDDMSEWEVITDIQDLEDGKGGMDFKITGTRDGITAIQLDTKTDGLAFEIVKKALLQGCEGVIKVIENLDTAIEKSRDEISEYAPKIVGFEINPAKIGEVIGGGGKTINKIIEMFEVTVDIEDNGMVMVGGIDIVRVRQAVEYIKELVKEYLPGEKAIGKVVRVESFGAFVAITAMHEGLVHVSEIAPYRVENVGDILKIGDVVNVQVKEINDKGQISLTMKGLEGNEELFKGEKGKSAGGGGGFSGRLSGDAPRTSGGFNRSGGNSGGGGGFGRGGYTKR
ncbi:polyribonucleotide nucleotidyltransferase [Patescibacteria group bacterium]|nr:polyribonucleotide nucleotidyltransferase [Patescibacteria group bacterium]